MPNQTFMQFVSNTGTYTFDQEAMPLIGRRVEYARQSDQGQAGNRRINCTLNGFFYKNSHKDVVAEYKKLLDVLKCNDAKFTYKTDNLTTVLDQRVYIDGYDEPVDWKQYTGDYNLSFHYFEQPNHLLADLGITAIYSPNTGAPFNFETTPHWAASFKPNRANFRAPRVTPSGQAIANETQVTLEGRLAADDHVALRNKAEALTQALQYDGVLNYGAWTNNVRVEGFSIPTTFPRNYLDYQIVFKYDSPGIIEFRSKREIGRIHGSPKITEIPFCGTVRTQVFPVLGQEISYFFSLRAMTISAARTALANEVANMVITGGIEMPGGKEIWDDSEPQVTLNFTKYYFPYVVNNLAGS
jgi:hypothetical protein